MAEATSNIATFGDVSVETFTRFCQFAYTRNYATPTYKIVEVQQPSQNSTATKGESKFLTGIENGDNVVFLEPPTDPTEEDLVVDDRRGFITTKKSKRIIVRTPQQDLRKTLEKLRFDVPSKWVEDVCHVRDNTNDEEDYTSVFLGHAELYVFADKWGVLDLKMQTLTKLHLTLTSFKLFEARRRDVVELLRFVYDNENTRDRGDDAGTGDELRTLVMLYTGCEFENLMKCSDFMELMGEGGELVQDLMKMLLRRLG